MYVCLFFLFACVSESNPTSPRCCSLLLLFTAALCCCSWLLLVAAALCCCGSA